jgi:glutamate racemase
LTFYYTRAFVNCMIGIYDSGIGGLSVADWISTHHPTTDIVFWADTKYMPLGEKPESLIITVVDSACRYLHSLGCELIILACNTASAVALRQLQTRYSQQNINIRVIGIIIPIIESTQNLILDQGISNVVLIATPATVKSRYYLQKLDANGINNILQIPTQGLAKAIEDSDTSLIESILSDLVVQIEKVSNPLVVLACTHYIFIQKELEDLYYTKTNRRLSIISQLDGLIGRFDNYCKRKNISLNNNRRLKILVNGDKDYFSDVLARRFSHSAWSQVIALETDLDS